MKYIIFITLVLLGLGAWYLSSSGSVSESMIEDVTAPSFTDTEVGFEEAPVLADGPDYTVGRGAQYTIDELRNWERPAGPLRVGVQVGHLENDQVPEELSGLTNNGAGATAAGYNERDTVAVIASLVAEQLRAEQIEVDVLPATVPPGYVADAFVSIHADGNLNSSVRGFKIAGPRRDYSGLADILVAALYDSYASATNLPIDPSISRRMTAYYAFNWPRYEHAVHPYTPSVIVETGFLSNPIDRNFLVSSPSTVATGIAEGIKQFLATDRTRQSPPTALAAPTFPLTGLIECAPVREDRRNRIPQPCEASLRDESGNHYLLVSNPPLATSSLPYQASIVSGTYMPVQVLDNYFWFQWEVVGMIQNPTIDRR
jgi:hypothetical protein